MAPALTYMLGMLQSKGWGWVSFLPSGSFDSGGGRKTMGVEANKVKRKDNLCAEQCWKKIRTERWRLRMGAALAGGGQGRVFQEGCLAADLNGEKQGDM